MRQQCRQALVEEERLQIGTARWVALGDSLNIPREAVDDCRIGCERLGADLAHGGSLEVRTGELMAKMVCERRRHHVMGEDPGVDKGRQGRLLRSRRKGL